MKVEIIATKDGSHSLFREDLNETYHSTHGAEAESRYVFMKMVTSRKIVKKKTYYVVESFENGIAIRKFCSLVFFIY